MSYPEPSWTGEVPFTPAESKLQCSTFYSLWGDIGSPSDATPLICLYGGPGVPSHYFKPFGLLHQQFKIPVITYNQIGCGRRTRLPGKRGDTNFWLFELFIAELSNLLTSLSIQKYDVFGHSWGGLICHTIRSNPTSRTTKAYSSQFVRQHSDESGSDKTAAIQDSRERQRGYGEMRT
jgi:L-proline amide hydrolase